MLKWWPVSWQWGGGVDGAANRICWSGDQSADSGVVGLMGQLTGYVGGVTSWLTVGCWGWWGSCQGMLEGWPVGRQWGWSDDQLADSGVEGLTSWLTVGMEWWPVGQQGMLERWPVGWQWGWSDDQSADSGDGVVTSQPTRYVGAMTSRPTVGWWGWWGGWQCSWSAYHLTNGMKPG